MCQEVEPPLSPVQARSDAVSRLTKTHWLQKSLSRQYKEIQEFVGNVLNVKQTAI